MERLRNTLAVKVEEVHDLKVKVHELQFGGGKQGRRNPSLEYEIGRGHRCV